MYFPYLHGRQAELGAITDLSLTFGSPQRIYPVIEPVDANAGLERSLVKLKAASRQVYLIVNPHQGDLKTPAAVTGWTAAIAPHLADASLTRPVLREAAGMTAADIAAFAAAYPGRAIGVILGSTRLAPADVASALAGTNHLVFLRPGVNALGYASALGADKIVEINDNFVKQARNADYSGSEWLGNNHLTYAAAGQVGFSDFTVLPGAFQPGGGPVGAAAFHLSFEETDGSFWVQHFISDEVIQSVGTSSSKLLEALAHLQAQITATPGRFPSSPALATYLMQLSTGSPTNLSGNKKQQIAHHLHLVSDHLGL